jgi:predicted ATPase
VFVQRAVIRGEKLGPGDLDRWPFTVPAVAQLVDEPLRFAAPLTFLVGDNGSGKSTIVEAVDTGAVWMADVVTGESGWLVMAEQTRFGQEY